MNNDREAKVLLMYNENYNKDMWHVDNGSDSGACYVGLFDNKELADEHLRELINK